MTSLPPPGDGDQPPATDTQIDPTADPVIATQNERLDDGVNRCPQCGATEIQLRPSAGMLICLFCRHEWSEARIDETISNGDLAALRGTTVGSGASDIDTGADSLITLKCAGCGAEVVVDTAEQMGARCHWCRHVLTVNEQVPNGAVPDAVLPFSVTHDVAMTKIREFAGKRRLFADRAFVRDFKPENVVGVYMPYMVVDGNVSADVVGRGEIETRQYTRGTGDNKETFYDADVYEVQRHVDFTVDDLTIESSAERANRNASVNTNNVINTILPFDTENAVTWNASYITGFTSEKRDQDVSHLEPALQDQLLSIARTQVESSVDRYDRGVRWERERLDVHGTRWISMYLPVWLYSHFDGENGRGMVHYIAVNGRTGEVMGSVPVSHPRLIAAALTVGTIVEAVVIAILAAS
ncbi:MAG: TFIIB-type zinc ribbon-containing protein [Ilumatobacteraceae bacterium]